MGVNLSIKDVPEDQVARLKERARRNHRSLQGELRAIVEAALGGAAAKPIMTVQEARDYIATLNLPSADEATAWIREDRER